jgi:hypothetical protein
MNAKAGISIAFVLGALGASAARAQMPAPSEGTAYGNQMSPLTSAPTTGAPASTPSPGTTVPGHLSNWITYNQPGCCGPIGGNGPVTYDIYVRTGPDFVAGSGFLAHELDSGWQVEGGGRSLFFNVPETAAWVADLGLGFTYNHSIKNPDVFTNFGNLQTVKELHRTLVRLGFGREWYLSGAANTCDPKWLIGVDAGGRYGPARLKINDVPAGGGTHISDVIGAAYFAVYSGVEIPCGCCKWEFGLRFEYDYTWQDILQQNSDVQDLMLSLTGGFRF